MKRRSALFSLLCFVMGLFGCEGMTLNHAYRNLYLSKYAIEFPDDQATLDNCIATQLATCIKLYEAAREGKQLILSTKPTVALNHVLTAIQERCRPDEQFDVELCKGAVVSLYFFSEPAQDEIILETFKKFPPALQSTILTDSPYAWFSNRPQPKLWEHYIQSLPESDFPRISKQQVIRLFGASIEDHKHGVVLL